MQCVVQQIILSHCDPNVVTSGYDVGRGSDPVHLEDRGLVVITLGCFPRLSPQEIRIIEGCVVIAPVGYVLDRTGSRNRRLETSGLRDQPVGHVSPVTVTAHGEMIG